MRRVRQCAADTVRTLSRDVDMPSFRVVAPALLLLFAGCNPPPESAPRPSAAIDNTSVKDANTSQPINFTVRAEKFVSNATVDGKLEEVWSMLPDIYKGFGLPVDGINSVTRP